MEILRTISNLPFNESRKHEVFQDYYFHCMLSVGEARTKHIYEINKKRLIYINKPESHFLLYLIDFFYTLNTVDQYIFVCEILEKGLVYPFWYLKFRQIESGKELIKQSRKVFKKLVYENAKQN